MRPPSVPYQKSQTCTLLKGTVEYDSRRPFKSTYLFQVDVILNFLHTIILSVFSVSVTTSEEIFRYKVTILRSMVTHYNMVDIETYFYTKYC